MLKAYGVALGLTTALSGVIKQLVFRSGGDAKHYLVAVFLSLLLMMLCAVMLAVFDEHPLRAPVFVGLAATLSALLYYRLELANGSLSLALISVIVVAIAVWVLASAGCYLRRRLRAMD